MTKLLVATSAGFLVFAGLAFSAGPAAADPSFSYRKPRPLGQIQPLPKTKPYTPPVAPATPPKAPTAPFSTFAKPAPLSTPAPFRPYQDKTQSLPKNCNTSPVYLPPGQIDAYSRPGRCILR